MFSISDREVVSRSLILSKPGGTKRLKTCHNVSGMVASLRKESNPFALPWGFKSLSAFTMEEDLFNRRYISFLPKSAENFNRCSLRFEALLESKDLLDVINFDLLADTAFEDLDVDVKAKLLKAKSLLVQSVGDKPL